MDRTLFDSARIMGMGKIKNGSYNVPLFLLFDHVIIYSVCIFLTSRIINWVKLVTLVSNFGERFTVRV